MSRKAKKRSRPRSRTRSSRIEVIVADPAWRTASRTIAAHIRKAAHAALAACGDEGTASATILLTDDAQLHALNKSFRRKDKPTNVLSFPAVHGEDGAMGDIAIAYGVTAREAAEMQKRFVDHAMHLAVHGMLHLAGYDHETARDAKVMEQLETEILAGLGIADPYAPRVRAA